MTVTPPCDTASVTTQLRLLSAPEPTESETPSGASATRTRVSRTKVPARRPTPAPVRLSERTRQIGQTGVAEARRRLAEIQATGERARELVRAS